MAGGPGERGAPLSHPEGPGDPGCSGVPSSHPSSLPSWVFDLLLPPTLGRAVWHLVAVWDVHGRRSGWGPLGKGGPPPGP